MVLLEDKITLRTLLLHSEKSVSHTNNLPCKEQDTKREDDSIRWILRIIFSFFRNG